MARNVHSKKEGALKRDDLLDLVSAAEGEAITGLRRETLRKWAWQRKIRSFKVLGALRFSRNDLEKLILERPPIQKGTRE
jgi:hypothetical protein